MKADLPDRTMRFAVQIVKLCQSLDRQSAAARTLSRQLLRSGTSIGANVAEAQGAQSKRDFIAKYSIAFKEARETQFWLRLLVEADIVPEERVAVLKRESTELVAILTTLVKTAKRNV